MSINGLRVTHPVSAERLNEYYDAGLASRRLDADYVSPAGYPFRKVTHRRDAGSIYPVSKVLAQII